MASRVAERLKHYRKLCKMSQEELAKQLGVPLNTISKIEHGARKVTLDEAVQLAEVLGISLADLAGMPYAGEEMDTKVKFVVSQSVNEVNEVARTLNALSEKLKAVCV